MAKPPLNRPFGISPAFVRSRYTMSFTTDNYVASIQAASALGFESYQPEIFFRHPELLIDWVKGGARKVAQAGRDHGMIVSQFVAHFLLENFGSIGRLSSTSDTDDLKRALEAASAFEDCPVFSVPHAPYEAGKGESFTDAWSKLVTKMSHYKETIEAAGFTMAIEVLNGSLVSNCDGFLRLVGDLGDDRLGINLDTGHAWAAKENLPLLPSKLGTHLVGLHLKDNDGNENLQLAPNKGTVPWSAFMAALRDAGYTGCLDIEFNCPRGRVIEDYAASLAFLKGILNQQPKSQ